MTTAGVVAALLFLLPHATDASTATGTRAILSGRGAPSPADPGSAPWWWLAWILAFVAIELALYWRRGTAGTFSALVWRWLDVGPGGERYRRVRWAVLALAILVLGWHLLAGGW